MQDFNRSPDFRVREIAARPVWTIDDLILMTGIPRSTLELVMTKNPIPGMFTIGRRRHVMADNAMAWLKDMEKNNPYQPRTNNPQQRKVAA